MGQQDVAQYDGRPIRLVVVVTISLMAAGCEARPAQRESATAQPKPALAATPGSSKSGVTWLSTGCSTLPAGGLQPGS